PDRRPAWKADLGAEPAVERRRPLGERIEHRCASLGRAVVLDDQLDASGVRRPERDLDAREPAALHGLLDRVTKDLVEGDGCVLAERLGRLDVDVDLDVVTGRDPSRERGRGRSEAELLQDARLEIVAELSQIASRVAGELESARKDLPRAILVASFELGEARIEHLRDRRKLLDGAVVDELCDAATLLLLGEH